MITTHLVTKNHANSLEKTLQSVSPLNGHVLVADLGSTDDTVSLCKKYGAKVVSMSFQDDYSQIRNELLSSSDTEWNFYIRPGEILASGHDQIEEIQGSKPRHVQVFQGNVITKETRLWTDQTFQNPVFESIFDESEPLERVAIYDPSKPDHSENMELVEKWKERSPAATETHYYEACILLAQGKLKEFQAVAKRYLFYRKRGMPSTMTRYYWSLVQMHLSNDMSDAFPKIIKCISEKPLMAEFWCLLGDIYYKSQDFKKAIAFYENAIILGSKRPQLDDWPLEIAKYKEYPEHMIESADKIINSTKYFGANISHQAH